MKEGMNDSDIYFKQVLEFLNQCARSEMTLKFVILSLLNLSHATPQLSFTKLRKTLNNTNGID